ncbi:bifunctional transcriptional activator/DNA repair enzyme AdaA [Aliikangiella sp. IMCC44632]
MAISNSHLPAQAEMYRALCNKDPSYEGIFIVGVKTTGIFCRPTCTARKPKPENVEFFGNTQLALNYGYRPCKVCQPMRVQGETPEWLQGLLKEISACPGIRITDQGLRERQLDPVRVRRWFKKNHGITFQAYLRSLRVNHAFGQIRHQQKVTDAALASGYDSISGFNEAFKQLTGVLPSKSKQQSVVIVNRLLTPLGPMFVGATEAGICLLEFCDRRMLETQFKRLTLSLNARIMSGNHELFSQLENELAAYFNGQLRQFKTPLDLVGTDFQRQVWAMLLTIPYAQTRSYQQQAELIGNPKAVRAVAKANGDNKISILVPCHRVIGKNGKLTGYGGGLWRKQRLLDLEQNQQTSI